MTKRIRRNHSPDLKAKVAPAAMKGDRTIAQLLDQYGDHASQITTWKDQLLAGAANVFGPGGGATSAAPVVDIKALHAKIGELTPENDCLEGALSKAGLLNAKRRSTLAVAACRGGNKHDHQLSVTRQANAAGIARSTVYYTSPRKF